MEPPITETKGENIKNQEGRIGYGCFFNDQCFFKTQFEYTPNKQKEYALKLILNVSHSTPNTKF